MFCVHVGRKDSIGKQLGSFKLCGSGTFISLEFSRRYKVLNLMNDLLDLATMSSLGPFCLVFMIKLSISNSRPYGQHFQTFFGCF